jgi:hypothetical protein
MNAVKVLEMVARLGKALFWAECVLAAIIVAGGTYYGWIGRVIRRVLAGTWAALVGGLS